jgi:metal-dependent amidase/aminoacylase/carboxypeptidase family protein
MQIIVKGRSAHGAYPWSSVDPIVTSAQIINNLQTIVSRNINVTENPAVVTIGAIKGGNRSNIIPEAGRNAGHLTLIYRCRRKMLVDALPKLPPKPPKHRALPPR